MTKRFPALLIVLLAAVLSAHGQLRDYVAIVEPVFHEETRRGFSRWADYFAARGEAQWERFFRWYSGELGPRAHGSGWVHVSADDRPWLITNRHVVKQADTARVIFEDIEGERRIFDDISIAYVDEVMDLAVLALPKGAFEHGFPLQPRRAADGTDVVAVGFPGFGRMPLWQFSTGIVSNAAARIDPAYSYLIQHTAPIDPGNSGGPLLVRSEESPLGYTVIGVNVSKAVQRQNTSFAIPAQHVEQFVERAQEAIALREDPAGLSAELEQEAEALARVLAAPEPKRDELAAFISYAFVGSRGFQSYVEALGLVPNREQWIASFRENPIETMRASINLRYAFDLYRIGDRSTIRFLGIEDMDEIADDELSDVTTLFLIGGYPTEVSWTREYGHWRVKRAAAQSLADLHAFLPALLNVASP